MEGHVNTFKCPHPSCVWSISEYSSEELETHREEEHNILELDNMIGSPDMNCNLLNQNELSPLPSDSEPQQESEEEELQQVSYFIERIYSQPVVAEYRVKTIPKLVIHSDANKFWHVRRGTGNFNISFSFDELPQIAEGAEFQLKFELKRSHPSYVHVPVNVVCEKHLGDDQSSRSFPIIASISTDVNYSNYKETSGKRRSFLLYKLGRPMAGFTQMTAEVSLRFPCNDTCVNTDFTDLLEKNKAGKVVMKEKSRFLQLAVTLEARQGEVTVEIPVAEEIFIPVWIKAAVVDRELQMSQRHSEKGGAATKNKTRKRSVPSSAGCGPDDKREKTEGKPGLSDLVKTFQSEQERVWKSLQETFDEEQRDMVQSMMDQ